MPFILKHIAVMTIEPMLKNLSIWVQLIQDSISISMVTGCEDYDLEFFRHFLQECQRIRSDVDADCHINIISLEC